MLFVHKLLGYFLIVIVFVHGAIYYVSPLDSFHPQTQAIETI